MVQINAKAGAYVSKVPMEEKGREKKGGEYCRGYQEEVKSAPHMIRFLSTHGDLLKMFSRIRGSGIDFSK